MTAFSLPWYAIVGAQKGVTVGLPVVGCLLLAVVGPTAGRYYIDITSGKTAKQFIRSEWFIGTAAADRPRLDPRLLGGRQHLGGHGDRLRRRVRVPARRALPRLGGAAPEGAEGNRRPQGSRAARPQAHGKSQSELRDLGLTVENGQPQPMTSEANQ